MEQNMENQNQVRKEIKKSTIEVSRIYASAYQKEGTLTAELKQAVTISSYYPKKSITNDLQDNLFKTEDFSFGETCFEQKKIYVTWLDVPEGTSIEDVKNKLNSNPNATIYRIISNYPIFHSGQKDQISRIEADTTISSQERVDKVNSFKNQIANRQLIRYSADAEDLSYKKNEIVKDSLGRPQYKADFFSENEKKDIDLRNPNNSTDYFTNDFIDMELNQTVKLSADQQF